MISEISSLLRGISLLKNHRKTSSGLDLSMFISKIPLSESLVASVNNYSNRYFAQIMQCTQVVGWDLIVQAGYYFYAIATGSQS